MKAVQVVIDDALLARLDRVAKKAHLSRSAFIRRSLEETLRHRGLQALIAEERAAYQRQPVNRAERAAGGALEKAQARVLDKLAKGDRW